ncbi:MAG TPA: hypothetical protein VKS21_05530 [Spirochaetota bacterium]|nr:hypothetical protein [Spirochaetota bacterium]
MFSATTAPGLDNSRYEITVKQITLVAPVTNWFLPAVNTLQVLRNAGVISNINYRG